MHHFLSTSLTTVFMFIIAHLLATLALTVSPPAVGMLKFTLLGVTTYLTLL